MTFPISILDLATVPEGASSGDAMRSTLALAQAAERLGYTRFWVAEHHNMPGVASSATSVLIGYLAAGFFVSVFWYPLFWVNLAMTVALHEVARREANARVVVSAPGRGTAAVQRRALRS